MLNEDRPIQYYLFAFANFLAAFGGGMILGKGINIIQAPLLQGGSVLAFFVGTILGLILLQNIPKKISALFAQYFSISGGISSLILLGIYINYSTNGKLIGNAATSFFFILSIRFGFWFYSRVLRASSAAGKKQRIAWVELGYYSGMILGLIIWKFIGFNIGIITALFTDAFLQFIAGFLDLVANKKLETTTDEKKQSLAFKNTSIKNYEKTWGWRLASAAVFLTVGIQVVIFSLTHQINEYFSSYVLAVFYLGASIAAFFCKKFNIQLEWRYNKDNKNGYAIIFSEKMRMKKEISPLSIGLASIVCVVMTIFGTHYWLQKNIHPILLLVFVFCSAFFYEILALAILDRIGFEERFLDRTNMVIRTYGLMGISAAISLWIIELTNSSWFGLFLILGICATLTISLIWKRKQLL